ncbi:MFS general substrate transporter [Testicularia cyperi]|uniref:MFS general substrate transporter n=1 Tax=Testicularia cyperi TaxID=1882483 RepID=A0A317XPJ7_9BASI|nr:MFS general substrate transporter [Testicularia cyperi]
MSVKRKSTPVIPMLVVQSPMTPICTRSTSHVSCDSKATSSFKSKPESSLGTPGEVENDGLGYLPDLSVLPPSSMSRSEAFGHHALPVNHTNNHNNNNNKNNNSFKGMIISPPMTLISIPSLSDDKKPPLSPTSFLSTPEKKDRLSPRSKEHLKLGASLVLPLSLVYVFSTYVAYNNLGIIKSIVQAEGLDFDYNGSRWRGLQMSYWLGAVGGGVPVAMTIGRVGHKPSLAVALFCVGMLNIFGAVARGFAGLVVVRMLMGAIGGAILPSTTLMLLGLFGPGFLVLPLAVIVSGGPGLGSLGTLVAGKLSTVAEIGSVKGWRCVLLVEGFIMIGAAGIAYLSHPPRSKLLPSSTAMGVQHRQISSSSSNSNANSTGALRPNRPLPTVLLCGAALVAAFTIGFLSATLSSQIPESGLVPYTREHNWDIPVNSVSSLSMQLLAWASYLWPRISPRLILASSLATLLATILFDASSPSSSSSHPLPGLAYLARILIEAGTQCQIPLLLAMFVSNPWSSSSASPNSANPKEEIPRPSFLAASAFAVGLCLGNAAREWLPLLSDPDILGLLVSLPLVATINTALSLALFFHYRRGV